MTYTSTLHVDTVRLKKTVQLLSQIMKMSKKSLVGHKYEQIKSTGHFVSLFEHF